MRGYRSKHTDPSNGYKLISRAGLGALAATILCVSVAAPVPRAEAATTTAPGANGLLPSRVLLLIMLDSLEDALAGDPERPVNAAEGENDGLEAGAQSLILGYSMYGIDAGMLPEDALEAAVTADNAEWVLVTGELGLDPSLAADLFATLQSMEADLQAIGS